MVTGWIPHWMFAKWKLRFLEDPKKVYGDDEHVDTVVNPGLEAKAADATAFLKKFSWSGEEVGAVMLAIRDGAKPEQAAKDWIAANPERVAGWFDGERSISVVIRRQPGANILEVIDRVKALLPELSRSISPAIDVQLAIDRAGTIRASVHEVELTLVISIALVIVSYSVGCVV